MKFLVVSARSEVALSSQLRAFKLNSTALSGSMCQYGRIKPETDREGEAGREIKKKEM